MHADVDLNTAPVPAVADVADLGEPLLCACAHFAAVGDTRDDYSLPAPAVVDEPQHRWWRRRTKTHDDGWVCGWPASVLAFWRCTDCTTQHLIVLCEQCAQMWTKFPEADRDGIRFITLSGA